MKIQYKWFIIFAILLFGCDLEQIPQDTLQKMRYLEVEKGLELYSYSFYDFLPSANNIHTADGMSDYAARRGAPPFIMAGCI